MPVQAPSLILPAVPIVTGLEVETVADALVHTSYSIRVESLQEKVIHIYATEIDNVGNPGPLNVWIQTAPWDVPAAYVVLGVPTVIVPTGVTMTLNVAQAAWTAHSPWCRIVCQALGAGAIDFWLVQITVSAKGWMGV